MGHFPAKQGGQMEPCSREGASLPLVVPAALLPSLQPQAPLTLKMFHPHSETFLPLNHPTMPLSICPSAPLQRYPRLSDHLK